MRPVMTPYDSSAAVAGSGFWPRLRERVGELSKQARIAFRTNPLGGVGLFLIAGMVLVAVFAPQIATHDPTQPNSLDRLQPPGVHYLFGTDTLGRDIFSRVVYGSRISLRVVAVVLAIALTIGAVAGAAAGSFGGLVDEIVMRVTDVFLAFPSLILALAINAALGPGLKSAMFAVAITWWPGYARMIRAQVLATKNNLYVEAARAIGASHWRVLVRHVLPNCIAPTIVQLTLDAGFVVLTTAGLSFVGLGAQPPTPEWGFMVNEGRSSILSLWWWATFPGLAITLLVVGFNLAGDLLRDLLDPHMRAVGA
jgi:peptide/nickel transport system permease protein